MEQLYRRSSLTSPRARVYRRTRVSLKTRLHIAKSRSTFLTRTSLRAVTSCSLYLQHVLSTARVLFVSLDAIASRDGKFFRTVLRLFEDNFKRHVTC